MSHQSNKISSIDFRCEKSRTNPSAVSHIQCCWTGPESLLGRCPHNPAYNHNQWHCSCSRSHFNKPYPISYWKELKSSLDFCCKSSCTNSSAASCVWCLWASVEYPLVRHIHNTGYTHHQWHFSRSYCSTPYTIYHIRNKIISLELYFKSSRTNSSAVSHIWCLWVITESPLGSCPHKPGSSCLYQRQIWPSL